MGSVNLHLDNALYRKLQKGVALRYPLIFLPIYENLRKTYAPTIGSPKSVDFMRFFGHGKMPVVSISHVPFFIENAIKSIHFKISARIWYGFNKEKTYEKPTHILSEFPNKLRQ